MRAYSLAILKKKKTGKRQANETRGNHRVALRKAGIKTERYRTPGFKDSGIASSRLRSGNPTKKVRHLLGAKNGANLYALPEELVELKAKTVLINSARYSACMMTLDHALSATR